MRAVMLAVMFGLFAGVCAAGEVADAAAANGTPVPYRIVPVDQFAAVIKNWGGGDMPHYAVIKSMEDWDLVFQPTVTMGNKRPTHPDPELFAKERLVAISRVSDAPEAGQEVLEVKSLFLEDDQLVLTYAFMPPEKAASYKAKNTVLVAIPVEYSNALRFVEEIEPSAPMDVQLDLGEPESGECVKP